ncbi:exported protein [Caldovatus sediminis]|uniref:Exported protein n=1 Tax=Caldovatus sediminis TaxID=2041189 RepID=A0A8J3EDD3_9PROT|nr:tripartite tricarboxylate transporter substrate-binding protein [Caldovatus sediminis]GGG41837.1 exported protein [Caldovatus sediminis]
MSISRRTALAASLSPVAVVLPARRMARTQPAFPSGPIRFVVAFPPGGPTDILGRMVAQKLAELRGWTVVVENRSGASGLIGMGEVARAAPDGHTVLINAQAQTTLPATHGARIGYDVASAFIPVTSLGRTPLFVTVTPSLPVRSIAELLDHARAHPGRLNYTAGSPGGGPHLAAEQFRLLTRVSLQFVPYRGSGPGLQDLAAGNVQVGFDSMTSASPLVRGGQIRPIAVTAPRRVPSFPDVPTVAETVPGFTAETWVGAFLPARTPEPVVARLHAALAEALAAPDLRERIIASGSAPGGEPREAFAAFVAEEMATWARVVREAGIRIA